MQDGATQLKHLVVTAAVVWFAVASGDTRAELGYAKTESPFAKYADTKPAVPEVPKEPEAPDPTKPQPQPPHEGAPVEDPFAAQPVEPENRPVSAFASPFQSVPDAVTVRPDGRPVGSPFQGLMPTDDFTRRSLEAQLRRANRRPASGARPNYGAPVSRGGSNPSATGDVVTPVENRFTLPQSPQRGPR